MKLWILSDLHLESVPFPGAFRPTPPDFDVLVSAGDIWSGDPKRGFETLRKLAGNKPVATVLGNHEYFKGEVESTIASARKLAKAAGVNLLEGNAVDIRGVRFVGCTLWTDYTLGGDLNLDAPTGEAISVSAGGAQRPLRISEVQVLHRRARERLSTLLEVDGNDPIVVVTHHAPHPACLRPAELGTWVGGNCASDLSELTDAGRAALWIFGHIHRNTDERRPGGTRLLSNPAGARFSNQAFDEHLVVDLDRKETA
ncbi:metallophosphoesterase [Bosea sp. ANAM02]|uniref:metallophosphoesterase n=1 Tax=Bosea sp. ANAM02 TaxID=2020412 RepID=UPI00140EABDA|nr:metallophosphoesterase [Bosea sp. ANAM02]BCB22559.1 phosphatase [Bosea sp. ANAM02]